MGDLLQQLESNDPRQIEEAKQIFHEQFNLIKEPWLLNGLYEHYLSTNSVPSMEILINIREPHHTHLFDKLAESIRGQKNDTKVQALTLLGHVVRKHPTWLHKITQHALFKEILKVLKNESDILSLLSALLVLIVLLPCIPAFMKPFLQEVFEIFSRLAAWNCNNPGKLIEEQMVHMQVGLYALFQRLYGMYPCNFLTFLRDHYRNRDMSPIFKHTIRPMLQTVQMHPLLVTNSKDFETTTERWKKMEAQDVVMECERYSLDLKDRFSHDTCFAPSSYRSRSGTSTSSTIESPYQFLKVTPAPSYMHEPEFFNPLQMIMHSQTPPVTETTSSSLSSAIPLSSHQGTPGQTSSGVAAAVQSQEGTSPPEAAIEATPETTPIKDIRLITSSKQYHPQHTTVARALNTFNSTTRSWSVGSDTTTPTHSQPSSPMRKDASTFSFPTSSEHMQHTSAFGLHKRNSYANQKLQKLIQDRSQVGDVGVISEIKRLPALPPTSPLRIINNNNNNSAEESVPSSPLPVAAQHHHHHHDRLDSPVSLEDEEVLAIVRLGDDAHRGGIGLRQCDSVLRDVDGCRTNEEEEMEECTSGGLHMPNSRQIMDFRKKVKRLRYHSQCGPDTKQCDVSAGNSPRNSVRRAKSCPEMKKEVIISAKDAIVGGAPLKEEDDDHHHHHREGKSGLNGYDASREVFTATAETQTENFWPMPYEHLFLSIFPSMENTEVKPSPAPSPAPYNLSQDKCGPASFNDILDRYIHVACQLNEKSGPKYMKDQLQLLHQQLLFERHRRETHAIRNRTLFTDVTRNKVLQEHNSALTDAVKLQEANIDELKDEINIYRKDKHVKEKAALDTANYWETKCKELEEKCRILTEKHEDLQNALSLEKTKVVELDNKWQTAEAMLLDANAEVAVAKEQVLAGEKGRAELVQVNRELLLAGEIILKYKERLADLSLQRRCDQEITQLNEAYHHEIKLLQQQLESKTTTLEACRTRISELEHSLLQYDESNSVQKKLLNEVKDECYEKLKVIESKYQTQLSINRSLEEKILELMQLVEMSGRRAIHSPDTSSCHEVNVTMTDRTSTAPGLSPHSSPLSASLASSEGSVAFMNSDVKDFKNLQIITDEKEPKLTRSSSTIESELCQEAVSSSSSIAGSSSNNNNAQTSKND